MSDSDSVPHAAPDTQAALDQRLMELEQERDDLQLMLDMAIEHSDILLDSLRDENHKLTLRLGQTSDSPNLNSAAPKEGFRLIVEAFPLAVIIARIVDGKIVYGNPATSKLLGVSVEALKQQKITDFCHNSETSKQLVEAMLTQQTFNGKLCWVKLNGKSFDTTASIQPFVFNDERVILMVIQTVTTLS
ncbi:MAG: PAS domain-containing protein [Leptolyngbyaceae cyanobacterium MAG.088]|nr:PAS domain-containing protein [Leptolyngbyaceae cyanobacterium MAG.088]